MMSDIEETAQQMANAKRYGLEPIDYPERLFKIKQLEYEREGVERMAQVMGAKGHLLEEIIEINAKISELLEDE